MIRNGRFDDIPAIVGMAREFWGHTVYDEEFEPDQVERMAEMCIQQDLMSVLVVNDIVRGFACGVRGPLLANASVFAGTEIAWWVQPEHRGGKNGIQLLRHIELLAKEAGVKYWNMVYMESSMPQSIRRIYEKTGYIKNEVVFTKVLK